jgi:TolB-like protein
MKGEGLGAGTCCLAIIGTWKLTAGDEEIPLISRKARDVLTFLALSDVSRHPRAILAEAFWPASSPELARSSLRQALSMLGKVLAENGISLLDSTAEALGLRDGILGTDIAQLQGRLRSGAVSTADCQIVETLNRHLLSSFGDTGPVLQDWLRDTRDRLLAEVQASLNQSIARPGLTPELRLRLARAGLALDEFNEVAARAIMACLLETGNAAAALRFYGSFHHRLEAELDAEPSIETQDLAVRIKQLQLGPTPPAERRADRTGALVAVLPFDLLGGDPGPGYISLGLLDQITCHLATFRAPAVISSNSTRGFLGKMPSIAEIRAGLGADYVVTGSVQAQGGLARVQVQLVDGKSGIILWAQGFQTSTDALFDIHATIAEKIANTLVPSIDLAELRRVAHDRFDMLEPYHLVLRAKELILRFDRVSLDGAGELLDQAERKDPGFGPLHALRAEWCALRLWQGWSDEPEQDRRALESHAMRAIAVMPSNGRCLALLGHCRTMFGQRHDEALHLFDTALAVCPNDAEALTWTVPTLSFCDDTPRAIAHGEKALALSPLDPFMFRNEHFLSIAHYAAGDMELAAKLGLSSHARAPDYSSNLRMTIAALSASGRSDEGRALVERHNRLHPEFSVSRHLPQIGFRRADLRNAYARHLIEAGLPV